MGLHSPHTLTNSTTHPQGQIHKAAARRHVRRPTFQGRP